MEVLADPDTDIRLLPSSMHPRTNANVIRQYKIALHKGIHYCLTPMQRELILLHYQKGLKKTEIASLKGCTCSTVCKSIKSGQQALKSYIEIYIGIYKDIQAELLKEEC